MPTKVPIVKAMVFPYCIWICELDCKESWVSKNWCFWTVVLQKTLKCPLDNKEIKPVNPKGNQPWIFTGRTDAEAEAPMLWPPDAKSQLIRIKTLMLGKIEGRRRRGWQRMRWLDGITNSMDTSLSKLWSWWWTGKPGVLQSTGLQRSDTTEQLNWTQTYCQCKQGFSYIVTCKVSLSYS